MAEHAGGFNSFVFAICQYKVFQSDLSDAFSLYLYETMKSKVDLDMISHRKTCCTTCHAKKKYLKTRKKNWIMSYSKTSLCVSV